MTPSRRSSRSAREPSGSESNSKLPSWRSLSTSKPSTAAPPSVSLVLAEFDNHTDPPPEPAASSSESLPSDYSRSPDYSRTRERLLSISSARSVPLRRSQSTLLRQSSSADDQQRDGSVSGSPDSVLDRRIMTDSPKPIQPEMPMSTAPPALISPPSTSTASSTASPDTSLSTGPTINATSAPDPSTSSSTPPSVPIPFPTRTELSTSAAGVTSGTAESSNTAAQGSKKGAELSSNAASNSATASLKRAAEPLKDAAASLKRVTEPPKRSWFGSLSRSRGAKIASDSSSPDSDPSANAAADPQPSPPPPALFVEPATPQAELSVLQPEVPAQQPPLQRAPASDATVRGSAPRDIPTSPPMLRSSTLSSLDSEVPSLPNSPSSPAWPSGSVRRASSPSRSSTSPTSSLSMSPSRKESSRSTLEEAPVTSSSGLNPSTSRFILSLPLLGRPKIPLEHAVKQVVDKAPDAPLPAAQEAATPTQEPQLLAASPAAAAAPEGQPSAEPQAEAQGIDAETIRARESRSASTGSWWDYVGWGSPQAQEDDAKTQCSDVVDPAGTETGEPTSPPPDSIRETGSAPGILEPAAEKAANGSPPNETSSPSALSPSTSPALKAPSTSKALSITSVADSSIWYMPWAWYYGSGTEEPEQAQASLTDAEMIKEAALARDREQEGKLVALQAEQEQQDVEAKQREVEAQHQVANTTQERTEEWEGRAVSTNSNPVSSIVTNKSGWASFFMGNRSLAAKRIEAEVKRDENGMEVMDIEEDEEGQASEGTTDKDSKDGSRPGSAPSSVHHLAPPESVKSDRTRANSLASVRSKAPMLVISDDVKAQAKEAMEKKAKEDGRKDARKVKEDPRKDDKERAKSKSRKSSVSAPPPRPRTPPPNVVLPTWQDTFHSQPRSNVPPPEPAPTRIGRVGRFVRGVLFNADGATSADGTVGYGAAARRAGGGLGSALRNEASMGTLSRSRSADADYAHFGMELPRAIELLPPELRPAPLPCKRCVVIGIHGWFPGAMMRSVLGEPTGTSPKFVSMMVQALDNFQKEHNIVFDKITQIPLEGEGMIEKRVEKLYGNLMKNEEWVADLHAADAIFVATHSQGTIVSTHLLDRLVRDKHIRTKRNIQENEKPQKVCCLALCGIHLGPLRYLNSSSLLQPYFQYFESDAARELFEFQNTENAVSKAYVAALTNVVHNGIKMVYVASLNDQVVPIYSGLFTYVQHPLILRALYMDGDAYHSSDFLSNLLVLLLRVMNSGLTDSGLITHLSEATAGSLTGVGHSTAYEDVACFALAAKYLFLTDDGLEEHPDLTLEAFNASSELNDYEIPWALRDLIADDRVAHFFGRDITQLRDAFREWHPKTTILRDIKRKLQPIQRLPSHITRAPDAPTFHSVSGPDSKL